MGIKFNMIGLFVNDLPLMVNFYKKMLGLEVEWNQKEPYAEFKHEGIRFSMYKRSELPGLIGQEPAYPKGINGTFELSINVGSKEKVDVFFKQVTDQGAKEVYAPRDEPWKMRSAMVADPEGNLIEIGSDFWD